MQGISGGLNHFSIVVVADAQANRNLEADRVAIDLKRNADLRREAAARGGFDARHLDVAD
jgi:hypothetical protein